MFFRCFARFRVFNRISLDARWNFAFSPVVFNRILVCFFCFKNVIFFPNFSFYRSLFFSISISIRISLDFSMKFCMFSCRLKLNSGHLFSPKMMNFFSEISQISHLRDNCFCSFHVDSNLQSNFVEFEDEILHLLLSSLDTFFLVKFWIFLSNFWNSPFQRSLFFPIFTSIQIFNQITTKFCIFSCCFWVELWKFSR